jgi:hypothetical protein
MGPRSPDAHHPRLFMFGTVLEEVCENAFSEHGGQAKSTGAREAEHNRRGEAGTGRKDKAGHWQARAGGDRFSPSLH